MTRTASRPLTLLLAFLLATTATVALTGDSDAAVPYPDATRIEGAAPIAAAVNISQELYGRGEVSNVVLARHDLFPDSLAATGFAGIANAPILFTPTNTLHPDTRDEILRVMTSGRVHILGGPNAISQAVENEIKGMGYAVSRYGGADRYVTARLIANVIVGFDPNINQVVIARGRGEPDATQGWVDAVACGAWAAERKVPILLVDPNGQPNDLPVPTANFLSSNDQIVTAHVCGGPAAVTDAQVQRLRDLGITNVFRHAGENRALTAIAASENLWKIRDARNQSFTLVPGYGDRFGYGIAASQLAAANNAPILLVDATTPTDCLSNSPGVETLCWLKNNRTGPAKSLTVIGSTNIVSDGVLGAAARDAGLERDQNPPGQVADVTAEDKPGDAGTAVRLSFSPVADPEGAEVSYDVYFRAPPEPEPEPTETETATEEPSEEPSSTETGTEEPTEDPSATETATEEPTEDPLTQENGTKVAENQITRGTAVVDEETGETVVVLDIEMCGREIPRDEETGEATSETPESTCKDTEYEFIVVAKDSGGNEALPSETVSAAPVDDVPAAPANAPSAEPASSGFTLIRWTKAPEADVAGYIVERTQWFDEDIPILLPEGCDTTWEEIGRVNDPNATSLTDNGTSPGESWCYRYRIIDTTGNESENSPALENYDT